MTSGQFFCRTVFSRHSAPNQQGESRFSGVRTKLSLRGKTVWQKGGSSVSAAGRGGDRRPAGAEAPTPAGRSARACAGQRKADCPLPRDREEAGGETAPADWPSRMAVPNAGYGVVGGKGLRKPLPPAASRAGYHALMLGNSRKPSAKKEKSVPPCRQPRRRQRCSMPPCASPPTRARKRDTGVARPAGG